MLLLILLDLNISTKKKRTEKKKQDSTLNPECYIS